MESRRILISFVLSASPWVALGCTNSGGQTGEETEDPCVESRTQLGLDAVSALGFTPRDVLANVGDSVQLPLTWRNLDGIEYGPEAGTSTIELRFEDDARAFWIASEPRRTNLELLPICEIASR
ncbi:MAG: hypothetical protein QM784_31510 [Polyangiaceae bacterium]